MSNRTNAKPPLPARDAKPSLKAKTFAPMSWASKNNLAGIVMCGLIGSFLPLAMPSIAIKDYRASVALTPREPNVIAGDVIADLHRALQNSLHSDQTLNRIWQASALDGSAIGISEETSYSQLLLELIGLSKPLVGTESEQVAQALRSKVEITQSSRTGASLIVSASALSQQASETLVNAAALDLSAQAEAFTPNSVSTAAIDARKSLEAIESELTTFQMKHGDEKIAQMAALKQEFEASKRTAGELRHELANLRIELQQVQNIQVKSALDQSLPGRLAFIALADLQSRYADAKAIVRDLSIKYGHKHPKMIAANGNVTDLQREVPKALRQSVDALLNEEKQVTAQATQAEQELQSLDERLAKLGHAPDEFAFLEKRLEAARDNYLRLADLEPHGKSVGQSTVSLIAGQPHAAPIVDWTKLISYSFGTGLFFAFAAFWISRRVLKVPVSAAPKKAGNPPVTPVVKEATHPSEQNIVADAADLPLTSKVEKTVPPIQDNDSPIDQRVKALLKRHAQKLDKGEAATLPPLVTLAVEGKLTLTEMEKRELSEIQQNLRTLRQTLSATKSANSRRL